MSNEIKWPFGRAKTGTLEIESSATEVTVSDRLEIHTLDVIEDVEITLTANSFLETGAIVILNITDGTSAGADITFASGITGSDILINTDDLLLTFVYDGTGFLLVSNQIV